MASFLKSKKIQYLLFIAVLVVILEILGLLNIHFTPFFEVPFLLLVIVIIGKNVLWQGAKSLINLKFTNINLLMMIAIVGAVLIGELEEAAVIVALFALSEQLEDLGITRSQSALNNLVDKTPKQITLKSGKKVDINKVKVNDIYIVKPGEMIALDGQVQKGYSTVDEAAITGESLPSEKVKGANVYSGSLNKQGTLEIKVSKEAKDSTISRIADLTKSALLNKAQYQTLVENFSKYYTPIVLLTAVLVIVIPTLSGQDFLVWFERGITLLVISCPCALVISTPISIFSAVGNASTKGILVKGGRFLEDLAGVKVIAFDKTRTLTKGEPVIEQIICLNGTNKEDLLSCAAGVEKSSEHPLSQAVVHYVQKNNLKLHSVNRFKAVAGKGVQAECLICKTGVHLIGNTQFLVENKVVIDDKTRQLVTKLQKSGVTPLLLADTDGMKGIIVVSDTVRSGAKALLSSLRKMDIKTAILSGDNEYVVKKIGKLLSVDEVKASLLPEDKVTEIKKLQEKYGMTVMIGDGVNDAPSLGLSDVGIALGAIGSDIAIESADIALMNDRIEDLPFLISLGRNMRNTIKFNVLLALSTKFLIFVLTIFGITGLAIAVFADVGVTFIVILISLRLLNFDLKN